MMTSACVRQLTPVLCAGVGNVVPILEATG
jgi:hypothetical protein